MGNEPRKLNNFLCYLLLTALSGCTLPYPAFRTIEPEAELQVLDNLEKPISGARVNLVTRRYPYGEISRIHTQYSDENGKVIFPGYSEWQFEQLIIHGRFYYSWMLCIQKDNYTKFDRSFQNISDFEAQKSITMQSGKSSECEYLISEY